MGQTKKIWTQFLKSTNCIKIYFLAHMQGMHVVIYDPTEVQGEDWTEPQSATTD